MGVSTTTPLPTTRGSTPPPPSTHPAPPPSTPPPPTLCPCTPLPPRCTPPPRPSTPPPRRPPTPTRRAASTTSPSRTAYRTLLQVNKLVVLSQNIQRDSNTKPFHCLLKSWTILECQFCHILVTLISDRKHKFLVLTYPKVPYYFITLTIADDLFSLFQQLPAPTSPSRRSSSPACSPPRGRSRSLWTISSGRS